MAPSSMASCSSSAEGLAPVQGWWSILTHGLRVYNTDINISTGFDGNHGTVNLIHDIIDEFSDFTGNDQRRRSDLDHRNAQGECIREHLVFSDDIFVQQHDGGIYEVDTGGRF